MKSSSDLKIQDNLAVVLVGDPKSGKTRLSMAFPTPYFLDLDKNLSSAARVAHGKEFYYDQVDTDDAGNPIPLGKQWERALQLLEIAVKNPKIQTIVIDSLTRAGELVEAHIIRRLKEMSVKLRPDTVDEQMRLADYDTYQTLILKAVALTRASGKYAVWTSHQTSVPIDPKNLDMGTKMRFSVSGKLKETFAGYFTDSWGLKTQNKITVVSGVAKELSQYIIRTRPASAFAPLGTSVPTLESEIDITDKNPNEIWTILSPKLSINLSATPVATK